MNLEYIKNASKTAIFKAPVQSEPFLVQCKEVKNTTSLLSVIMLLSERHVSTYSEAIIRFNK